jgi:hypothetical protein
VPERGFRTELWGEPWFQKWSSTERYLFMYLESNEHCRQSGMYRITLDTMSFETKIPALDLPGLLEALRSEVEWVPEQSIIWVKNFVKRQAKSPKFLVAAGECLKTIGVNGLIKGFLEYNRGLGLEIPYRYAIDTVSIPHRDTTDTPSILPSIGGRGEGLGKDSNTLSADRVLTAPKKGAKSVDRAKGPAIAPSGPDGKPSEVGAPLPAVKPERKDDRGGDTPAKKQRVAVPKTAGVSEGQASPEPPKLTEAEQKKESDVSLVIKAVHDHFGYPDKDPTDHVPYYGKECAAIKRALTRHFTVEQIIQCWKAKVAERDGDFVSFVYVNEDIGKVGRRPSGRPGAHQQAATPKRDYDGQVERFRRSH